MNQVLNAVEELQFLLRQCPSLQLRKAIKEDIHVVRHAGEYRPYVWEDLLREPLTHYSHIIGIIQRLTTVYPRVAWLHCFYARALAPLDLERAVQEGQAAIALSSEYPLAHKVLGDILLMADQPTEALASYQRTLTLCPEYTAALIGKIAAFLLLAEKTSNKAEKDSFYDRASACIQAVRA